jgi:hypothetical protein
MSTLSITAEGQITLSEELLGHLGVRPSDNIAITRLPQGVLEMKQPDERATFRTSSAYRRRRRHALDQ